MYRYKHIHIKKIIYMYTSTQALTSTQGQMGKVIYTHLYSDIFQKTKHAEKDKNQRKSTLAYTVIYIYIFTIT